MKAYQSTKTLRGIDVDAAMMGFNIENLTAKGRLLPDVRDTDVEMADISSVPQQTDHSESA